MDTIKTANFILNDELPKGFIVFISGVPGVGKTTVSYELFKNYSCFRLIEETDLIRDALRGYNNTLTKNNRDAMNQVLTTLQIHDHTKLLSLSEAKEQCAIMKQSILNIFARQQRKGISSIINGVHIIPEMFVELHKNPNVIFINLYVDNEDVLTNRIKNRDPESYMLDNISYIYQSNIDLYESNHTLSMFDKFTFCNINVSALKLDSITQKISECIQMKLKKF